MSIVDRYAEPLQAELDKRVNGGRLQGSQPRKPRQNPADRARQRRSCGGSKRTTSSACTSRPACGRVRRKASAAVTEELRKLEPSGESTRLGAAIGAVLDDLRGTVPGGHRPALTDGVNTEGPGLDEAAAAARRRGVPLLLVGLGDDKPVRDLKLADLLVDEVVFVDDVVYFEVEADRLGLRGPRGPRRRSASRDKPEVLAETKVKLGSRRPDRRPCGCPIVRPRWASSATSSRSSRSTASCRRTTTGSSGPFASARSRSACSWSRAYPNFEYRYLRNMLAPGQHDPAGHAPARRRPGTCRAGRLGAAGVSRAARGGVRLRRHHPRRRRPASCSASRRCRTWPSSSTSRARAARWCFWPGRGSCRWPSATRPWRGSCRSNWAASACRRPIGRSPKGSSSSRPSWG